MTYTDGIARKALIREGLLLVAARRADTLTRILRDASRNPDIRVGELGALLDEIKLASGVADEHHDDF